MHWMAGGRASALPAGVISKAHTSGVTYRGHFVCIGDIKGVTGFGYQQAASGQPDCRFVVVRPGNLSIPIVMLSV